ncbi:acyltransferase [Roseibacterium sp. KMU-115]|uniref:Acyltransferase n=2 Tax=Roseicyclus persicicus TaxID=2650661 RepID=A0A7X6GY05_9RHOB|nr:acyltransferase [Roseibacterium persicicum]
MTLARAFAEGRSGNLDGLRLMLAAAVVVSHAWPLALGPGTAEPLAGLTGHALGGWAVGLFFFLSGLLVTASAERRTARAFWAARMRRIVPGLGAALLVTLGLAYASGATAGLAEAAAWVLRALTLVSIEHRLTGAFAANPYPLVLNGPLWSLFHEVAAYALCFAFVALGGTRRPFAVAALLTLSTLAALLADALPGRIGTFAPLFAAFALGMAAHIFRARLPLSPVLALAALPLVAVAPWPLAIAALAYAALTLALRAPAPPLPGDISYGVYIYGWPVAQTIVHLLPGIGPVALAALSLAATLPLAIASWHLVERPALPRRAVTV